MALKLLARLGAAHHPPPAGPGVSAINCRVAESTVCFDRLPGSGLSGVQAPQPVLVLHMERGRIVGPFDLTSTPAWAKPIVATALELTHG